jgi:hypothetical protein
VVEGWREAKVKGHDIGPAEEVKFTASVVEQPM